MTDEQGEDVADADADADGGVVAIAELDDAAEKAGAADVDADAEEVVVAAGLAATVIDGAEVIAEEAVRQEETVKHIEVQMVAHRCIVAVVDASWNKGEEGDHWVVQELKAGLSAGL